VVITMNVDIDKELQRAYRSEPKYNLSIHFNRELSARIEIEKRAQTQRIRLAKIMSGYWLVATIVAIGIAFQIQMPNQYPLVPFSIAFGMLAVFGVLVPVVFYRLFRTNPFRLPVDSVHLLRNK
jgi:hypothetical protein